MKILITNNHLINFEGSEKQTFSFVINLKKKHDVDLYIYKNISTIYREKLKEKGISFYIGNNYPKKNYYVILANHTSCIKKLLEYYSADKIIQSCLGVYPSLEQPYPGLKGYVAVSKEVQEHLKKKNIESYIINQGIDTDVFFNNKPINNKLKNVLSLVKGRRAEEDIESVCKELNLKYVLTRKNRVFDVNKLINDSDLVISVGRGVYEAMSCGRNVIAYDSRSYYTNEPMGHGLLTSNDDIEEAIKDNFTGRNKKKLIIKEDLKKELLKYNPNYGKTCERYIYDNYKVSCVIDKYLELVNKLLN